MRTTAVSFTLAILIGVFVVPGANAQQPLTSCDYPQFLDQSAIARENRNWSELVRLGHRLLDGCPNELSSNLVYAG